MLESGQRARPRDIGVLDPRATHRNFQLTRLRLLLPDTGEVESSLSAEEVKL